MSVTKRNVVLVAMVVILGMPAAAQADWLLTPFAGVTFGGNAPERKLNYGTSIGFMGAGAFGFEIDFGYTPNFFDAADALDLVGDSNVTTFMVNVIAGVPVGGQTGGGVRPYVSGGAGLLKSHVEDAGGFFNVNNNDFGIDVGAGVAGFFSDNLGLRGDVRYFRTLSDPVEDNEFDIDFGSFDFWRGTLGLVIRF